MEIQNFTGPTKVMLDFDGVSIFQSLVQVLRFSINFNLFFFHGKFN